MNNRIRELAEQASFRRFFMPKSNSVSALDKFNGTFTEQEAIEKFAELIVKECAQLAMTQHTSTCPDDYNEMDPYDKGRDDVASTISGLICRTFGVK